VRKRRTSLVLAVAAAFAGCTKPSAPVADPPEEVFRRYTAAVLAADGKAQWALLSSRLQKQSEADLAGMKAGGKLDEVAKQLGVTADAVRAAGPLEFTTMIMKARTKDPAALARYKSLGPPRVFKDKERIRVIASAPDDGFTWTLLLVEEAAQWKVDEDLEEITPLGVYRMLAAAYLATDGKAQWALLSDKQRKQSQKALAEIKASAEQLDAIARQLGVSLAEVRDAGPEEFTTLVMKSRMKDPDAVERYKALGHGNMTAQEDRIRVVATTPDGRFTWTLWMVKERERWKVDEEQEEITDIVRPGEK
jgi:uncharacterized protein (DUF2126 family)